MTPSRRTGVCLLAACAASAMFSAALTARRSQVPTFSSRTDTVRVDVSVRRNGQAVRGLNAEDFEVYDNGVRQRVTFVGREDTPVNLVFALDMSDSLRAEGLAQLRAAAARLVATLKTGDSAALVGFTQLVEVRAGFTSEADRLLSALEIETDGSDTSLIDAAHAAMVLGDSATGRPLVIIFSDGADTTSFLTPNLVLDTARRTGAVVYAVTSAQAEVGGFLDELVGLTGGRRFDVPSLDRLSATFDRILAELRDRYLLGYTPTGVPRAGWHNLTVRVRGGGEVRARPGYLTAR